MWNFKHLHLALHPGAVVSIDQLVSPTKGFFPVHRGNPTTKRYIGATVFVDRYSDFTYTHLMTEMNAETTVEAKLAFECLVSTHDIHIRNYHCDNGLFDTHMFKKYMSTAHQTMNFSGVNTHHQNGKAEQRIGDVTTIT